MGDCAGVCFSGALLHPCAYPVSVVMIGVTHNLVSIVTSSCSNASALVDLASIDIPTHSSAASADALSMMLINFS